MTAHLSAKILLGDKKADQAFKDFLYAVEGGDIATMTSFLDANPQEINRRDSTFGATALHLAACVGNINSLKLLIDRGANLDILTNDNLSALHYAAKNKEADAFDLLLLSGAKVGEITFGNESIPSTSPENCRSINATKFFASRIR